MRQRIAKFSEETLMPVGFVLVIMGALYFTAQMFYQVEVNAKNIDKLEEKQDRYEEAVNRIDRRLSRIEGALEIKEDARDATH